MTRAFFAVSLCALALALPLAAQRDDSHPDFTGKWELLKEKSDFGNMEHPVAMTLVSERKEGYLHSVETTQTPQGDKVSENDWYPDGKRHDYSTPVPGYSVTRWDGKSLVSESKSNDGGYRQTIKLTMQSNGREALETVTSHTPTGDNHMKLYWRRQ